MEENRKSYARIILRVRAVLIDSLFFLALLDFGGLIFQQGYISEVVFCGWVIFVILGVFLYEPLFVSLFGSTIGQYFSNLYVEDANTGKKLSFVKAFFRYFIKFFLGWASFVTMKITKRLQAFHDVLTQSVVLVRDLNVAEKTQYSFETSMPEIAGIPSAMRRSLIIILYLITLFFGESIFFAIFISLGCLEKKSVCLFGESVVVEVLGLSLPFLTALIVYMGWQGKLFGCRRKRVMI